MPPGYRKDIDGLRAIAVLGVVLYHYGFDALGAGFAGVDIFFAISGYLIGGIVLDETRAGTFSFRAFYARRARRILPALIAMMLLTIPVAALLMSPHQLRYYGGGALASLLFVSNIWFYNLIDYFNPQAALDPLVHTWSLGIEEQFYLGLPVLILLLWRFARRQVAAVVLLLALASLALMLTSHAKNPSAAFYLIQYRAWELLAGVLAAMLVRRGALPLPFAAPAFASLGLGLVLAGITLTPAGVAWPSGWTLVPITGTVLLLLYGGAPSPARAVLSAAPMVAVGLISYSLYLWHQPIYSLAVIAQESEELPLPLRLALLVGCVAAAVLSWRFVEEPFRRQRLPPRVARWSLVAGAGALTLFAVGGHVTEGYPARLPEAARRAIAFEDSLPPRYEQCAGGRLDGATLGTKDACVHGAPVAPRLVIWGDSHAASLAQPIGQSLAAEGLSLREHSLGGCPPILGVVNIQQLSNAPARGAEHCSRYVQAVLEDLVADPTIELVVLFAFWNNYTERRDFDTGQGWAKPDKLFAIPVAHAAPLTEADRLDYLAGNLRGVVDPLLAAGKEVVLIYPMPEAPFNVPQSYARALWYGDTRAAVTTYPAAVFEDFSAAARTMLDALGERPGLHRIDASTALCFDGLCHLVSDRGEPLLRDDNHLSLPGSSLVVPRVRDAILGALAERSARAGR